MTSKRIPLIVFASCDGMVQIDDQDKKHICYANILGMYKTQSTQGSGVQINSLEPEVQEKVQEKCDKIATLMYELQDLLGEIPEPLGG